MVTIKSKEDIIKEIDRIDMIMQNYYIELAELGKELARLTELYDAVDQTYVQYKD